MAQLLVSGVDGPQTAEKVFDLAGELDRQELLELADVAWVERADGEVRSHQSGNLMAAGASHGTASGMVWGTRRGLLLLDPLIGTAIGAGTGAAGGALSGHLSDGGIDDDVIRQVGQSLQPGRAAVFFLARNTTVDRVVEAIRPYHPTVIQTNLSRDSQRELSEALQAGHRDEIGAPAQGAR